jgi:thioredoxin 1
MTANEELDSIREQKKQELQSDATESAGDDTATDRPDEPVQVESADHLNEITDEHDVVLVDFYADWCGPCKMVAPVVAALHDDGTAVVAKVDIDQHQALAQRQNVRGVPTMLLYANGDPVERVVGAKDKSSLEALISNHV